MTKRDRTVTVEFEGDNDSRSETGCSVWRVSVGDRWADIVHWHHEADMAAIDGAWYQIEPDRLGVEFVHSRDFGAALAVARRMLGVRS